MYGGPVGTHRRSFGRYHPRPFMASPSSRLGVKNGAWAYPGSAQLFGGTPYYL